MRITKLSIGVFFAFISTTSLMAQATQDTIKKNEAKNIEGVKLQGQRNKKTETAILQEQKKAVIQKQAMGAEEISRKGISNIEQGLTKITGINTVEGRGLFVRGLEERYNYLLINGLGSPSNNPFQKIIALKQFPTDVVGKLNIYKTFNSNLYADFAGATFEIETLSFEKAFTKVEFGIGVNTLSTFRNDFKISENANTMKGYIGLNSHDKRLPSEVRNDIPSGYRFSKDQSINSFKDNWNVDNVKSMPNTSFGFTTAQKFKAGESGTLGLLFSLNHGSKYRYQNGVKNQFIPLGSSIILNNDLNRKEYSYELESSVLLGLGYKNKGTNINFNGIFLQNSANLIQDYLGYRNNEVQNTQFFRVNQQDISRFLDLQLTASQKIGERHLLKAGASWVINTFSQPDRKIIDNSKPTGNPNEVMLNYGGNNLIRQYLDVNGKDYLSAFAEYSVGLGEKGDKKEFPWTLAVGYNGFFDRRSNSYRFIYGYPNDLSQSTVRVNIDRPQEVFNQSIRNNALYYREDAYSYAFKSNIYQFVNAGYLNVNFKPSEKWDILVGGRVENNMNITRYKQAGDRATDPFRNLTKNQYFVLPSLAVKMAVNDKSNLRFAASKTITRPILIEYMPIVYINPDNENIFGNKDLKNSENYNLDLKYEIFPTSKEMFAVNLFAKRIDNAIERSFITSGNSNGQTITFYNAKKATLAGIEIEGLMNLSRINENLNKWSLGANATFMYSKVTRGADQTEETDAIANRNRTLQGAAPWTVNADLKYEFKNRSNLTHTVSLVYNVSGKKIYGVGFQKLDNIYELPFHQLDVIYAAQLTKNWNLKLGIQNILDSTYKLDLGPDSLIPVDAASLRMTDYKRGTTFNLTIGYTF
ncbi:TonB-dependent receptor plug domain-containing protein [Elizabethkingia bruuniana]|nr:TonB-dependent receptor plug domain-containing protein [Elizabethkingia bruuniana]AQX87391.1 TonB-dependent receptor [Elizabethkingia bruuniana]KGO08963.1 TonB-dependent receptor [Elizabethkingia miricola]KUY25324.1 TonB-dependent receptor [Elizabethkingia bruuniana]OPB69020.1 TonB-dependent receptor [Elizabethkingia bruuniana]